MRKTNKTEQQHAHVEIKNNKQENDTLEQWYIKQKEQQYMKLHAKNNLNERKRTTNYETTHENSKTKKHIIEPIIIKKGTI